MPVSILLFVQEFLLFIKLLLSDRVFSSFIESKKQNLYEKKNGNNKPQITKQ